MRLLLDTYVLLWAPTSTKRLPEVIRRAIEDRENTILFSIASIWEIAIRAAMSKSTFRWDLTVILDEARRIGFDEKPMTSASAIIAAALPTHHKDPFDRLLVGQALSEPARLLTADKILARYSELVHVI